MIIFAITDCHAEAPVRGNVGREPVGAINSARIDI